ncbi:MAG: phytanoyl-CoA dioxygenase family protein [Planctomycetota bacterium]|nr:phytanoyl-CoA dioxygenase family protein [Planctomycetota bacterium]MDA1142861.1 phytanoyl-CoA dioxygenase family protein [Planctomycetota bacterium]
MITRKHIDQYWEEGYTLIRDLVPAENCDAVRTRALEVAHGDNDWGDGPFQILPQADFKWDDGSYIPIGIQGPARHEEIFKNFTEHKNFVEAMAALLRGKVKLFTDQIGVKYDFLADYSGGVSHYHQDSYYWHIAPELGCNCWFPLQEVDVDASALGVMPRSHEGWNLIEHEQYYDDPPYSTSRSSEPFKRHRIPRDQIDFSKEEILPMKAGDALFFTNYTWHRAEPNLSGTDKLFYAIAYKRE